MAEFTISIAGHGADIRSLFASTRDYCARYLSDGPGEFTIAPTPEDLIREQCLLDREADEEGLRRRRFSDPFLERCVIQRKLARHLLDRDILLLHGSCVALEGSAYLFTAPCGTGKSTHTRLWRETFPEALMVNDDKPFLSVTEAGVFAWGSPWSGKHGLDTNIRVPLRGICILSRGTENRVCPLPSQEARPFLLRQCQAEPEQAQTCGQLLDRLLEAVPLWQMRCTKDPAAAKAAHAAMTGKDETRNPE